MLDHISIPVRDIQASADFYDAALATLGYARIKQRTGAIGYGPATRRAPVFWIHAAADQGAACSGIGLHISLMADSRGTVDAFYAEALRQGGTDAGTPGERPQYTQPFYGAFVFDPDGFKIEAVYRGNNGSPSTMRQPA